MRKLVLVIVSVVLLSVFIAVNYLLWKNEQYSKSGENKEALINALYGNIKYLEDANAQLNNEKKNYEALAKRLESEKDSLEYEVDRLNELLEQRNQLIYMFKQEVDLSSARAVIVQWIDGINKGDYSAAASLMSKPIKLLGQNATAIEFENYYSEHIKQIRIKSIELYKSETPAERKGDIVFVVSLDVEKLKEEEKPEYREGDNLKYIIVQYDVSGKRWIISDILHAL